MIPLFDKKYPEVPIRFKSQSALEKHIAEINAVHDWNTRAINNKMRLMRAAIILAVLAAIIY